MGTDEYTSQPPVDANKDCSLLINGNELSVFGLDTEKEITVEQVRENGVFPIGDAVTEISYSGSITFKGRRVVVDSYLFDPETGLPYRDARISLSHDLIDQNGNVLDMGPMYDDPNTTADEGGPEEGQPFIETWHDVRVVSAGFELSQGEVNEVSYDWIALRKTPA